MNNFGEMQDSEKFVAQLIRKINAGETVTIHGEEGDIGSRYYLHARNHADAVLFLLRNTIPTVYSEGVYYPDRYNVVGEDEIDNLDMAQIVGGMLGKKDLKYTLEDFHTTRPGHDKRYALDGSKIKALGWAAPLEFETSMRRYIDWTLAHPTWL
jgi:dTDP-glucose 4,6-dehydratase